MATTGAIFELRTVQTNVFKTLIEALKEILTDANIEFHPGVEGDVDDKGSIKIIAMDPTQTVLVHLKLEGKYFEYYHVPFLSKISKLVDPPVKI